MIQNGIELIQRLQMLQLHVKIGCLQKINTCDYLERLNKYDIHKNGINQQFESAVSQKPLGRCMSKVMHFQIFFSIRLTVRK